MVPQGRRARQRQRPKQHRRHVRQGEGVPQDDTEAARWFRLAGEQGDANAQNNIGAMYAAGRGVPQDYAKALKWFQLAAEHGHAGAQNNLGIMYDRGEGVPRDDAEAVKWYRLAAEQGNTVAREWLEQRARPSLIERIKRMFFWN